jgi:hypothetical protein
MLAPAGGENRERFLLPGVSVRANEWRPAFFAVYSGHLTELDDASTPARFVPLRMLPRLKGQGEK